MKMLLAFKVLSPMQVSEKQVAPGALAQVLRGYVTGSERLVTPCNCAEFHARCPKCFGFVQTLDQKPHRRLWELMNRQRVQETQQLVFMSDGGEDVRRVQEYLHTNSEHLIDWFHITVRLTVLQQQTKSLRAEQDEVGAAVSKQWRA